MSFHGLFYLGWYILSFSNTWSVHMFQRQWCGFMKSSECKKKKIISAISKSETIFQEKKCRDIDSQIKAILWNHYLEKIHYFCWGQYLHITKPLFFGNCFTIKYMKMQGDRTDETKLTKILQVLVKWGSLYYFLHYYVWKIIKN